LEGIAALRCARDVALSIPIEDLLVIETFGANVLDSLSFHFIIWRRMLKEVAYYQKEVEENEAKLATMKEENRDPYDIKKFEEVLGESHMMIPDSMRRLEQTLQDLVSYVESPEVETHKEGEWYPKAQEVLTAERQRLGKEDDEVKETSVDDLAEGEAF
jgi:tubulin-specific chaperone A